MCDTCEDDGCPDPDAPPNRLDVRWVAASDGRWQRDPAPDDDDRGWGGWWPGPRDGSFECRAGGLDGEAFCASDRCEDGYEDRKDEREDEDGDADADGEEEEAGEREREMRKGEAVVERDRVDWDDVPTEWRHPALGVPRSQHYGRAQERHGGDDRRWAPSTPFAPPDIYAARRTSWDDADGDRVEEAAVQYRIPVSSRPDARGCANGRPRETTRIGDAVPDSRARPTSPADPIRRRRGTDSCPAQPLPRPSPRYPPPIDRRAPGAAPAPHPSPDPVAVAREPTPSIRSVPPSGSANASGAAARNPTAGRRALAERADAAAIAPLVVRTTVELGPVPAPVPDAAPYADRIAPADAHEEGIPAGTIARGRASPFNAAPRDAQTGPPACDAGTSRCPACGRGYRSEPAPATDSTRRQTPEAYGADAVSRPSCDAPRTPDHAGGVGWNGWGAYQCDAEAGSGDETASLGPWSHARYDADGPHRPPYGTHESDGRGYHGSALRSQTEWADAPVHRSTTPPWSSSGSDDGDMRARPERAWRASPETWNRGWRDVPRNAPSPPASPALSCPAFLPGAGVYGLQHPGHQPEGWAAAGMDRAVVASEDAPARVQRGIYRVPEGQRARCAPTRDAVPFTSFRSAREDFPA